jgi:hypothetical protein
MVPFMRLRSFRNARAWLVILSLLGLVVLALPATADAVSTITQGFSTTAKVNLGTIVSLQDNTSDEVLPATTKNVANILGVVIDAGNSLVSLSTGKTQIQVATSGIVQALVSDINGSVSQGDQITASPISGVGMKATDNSRVVGVAQQALNKNDGTEQSYSDSSGKHKVLIGQVPVMVNVSFFYKQPNKTLIPDAVQNIANALAGKPVSPLPILISMGIFVVTLIVVVSIIYSMIRSSIISVGRNPMAQAAIYRDIVQLSVLIMGILAVATISIYLVLKKL